jgi:hypothetical protein
MKVDFQAMSKSELRAYVLANRQDKEAFEALADRIYASPNSQWHQPEETEIFSELFANLEGSKIEDKT